MAHNLLGVIPGRYLPENANNPVMEEQGEGRGGYWRRSSLAGVGQNPGDGFCEKVIVSG